MKVKIVDPTLSPHRVIANSHILILRYSKDLKKKGENFVTQNLRKSFFSKKK